MGKKEQAPARAIFVQGSLWVWSAASRGRPPDGGLALAVFHMVPRVGSLDPAAPAKHKEQPGSCVSLYLVSSFLTSSTSSSPAPRAVCCVIGPRPKVGVHRASRGLSKDGPPATLQLHKTATSGYRNPRRDSVVTGRRRRTGTGRGHKTGEWGQRRRKRATRGDTAYHFP